MVRYLVSLLIACLLLTPHLSAADDQIEQTAAQLLKSTVTVRIMPAEEPAANQPEQSEDKPAIDAARGVTVCSGTSLGEGLILTFGPLPADGQAVPTNMRYRVTLPDGQQAVGQARVIDGYSGLILLEIEKRNVPGLSLAGKLPKIGGTVLAAAASGIEEPLVSRGILSGVDRTIGGTNLPPMLQCDISTTDASAGAAVVDQQGRLLGIIAATRAPGEKFGWTYAVSGRYIRRVLDARVNDRLVALVRRRPTVGLDLGQGQAEGTVRVNRVAPGGPADQAGIKVGDLLLEAEGRRIRSAYQAIALILKRQPGDKMRLVVGSAEKPRGVEVTLGGKAGVIAQPGGGPQVLVGPQIKLRVAADNQIEVVGRNQVAELAADDKPTQARAAQELELLRRQLTAYQAVIRALQEEIKLRTEQHQATAAELAKLQAEVQRLKQQLAE